jgi:hypothetical protein
MPQAKPKVESKTLWVNGLTAAAGVLAMLGGSDLIAAHPRLAASLVTALGVVNFLLRLVTNKPVE